MSHKKLLIILALFLIVALLICLLPWPTRINTTLSGTGYRSATSPGSPATVKLTGWYLNYLFLEDELHLEVEVPNVCSDGTAIRIDSAHSWQWPEAEFWRVGGMGYDKDINGFIAFSMCLSPDFSQCLVTNFKGFDYIAASVSGDVTLESLFAQFPMYAPQED